MSKGQQIYYNALFGAIGGLLAWMVVGSFATGSWPLWLAYSFVGAGVGLFIGGMTGAVDGIVTKQSIRPAITGGISGAVVGMISGAVGLLMGGEIFLLFGGGLIGRSLGWLLLGLLLGIGEGLVARSTQRASYGAIGGLVAGALGGVLYESLTQLFLTQSGNVQMIVSAIGLILIGACLGGIIPMTIAIFARGKLRVLTGRREGTEVDVLDAVTLGSYDGCELYLPGDGAIAKKHARVYRNGQAFYVEDLGAESGTLIDQQRLPPQASQPIQKGAQIQLGSTVVEFS